MSTVDAPETRQRILDAAVRCVQRWGVEKTSLNDIAREAGVTRPTVYNHFDNRDDVIQAALLQSGTAFAEALLAHVQSFDNARDRIVEALLFTLKTLPEEPQLTLVVKSDLAYLVNAQALATPESQAITQAIFQELLIGEESLLADIAEIAEVTTRFLLSLLMLPGPVARDETQMREFLRRRLLPALGL